MSSSAVRPSLSSCQSPVAGARLYTVKPPNRAASSLRTTEKSFRSSGFPELSESGKKISTRYTRCPDGETYCRRTVPCKNRCGAEGNAQLSVRQAERLADTGEQRVA